MRSLFRSKTALLGLSLVVTILAACISISFCLAQDYGGGAPPPPPPDGSMGPGGDGSPPPAPPDGAMGGENGAPPPPPPGGQNEEQIATTAVYTQDGGDVTKASQTYESTKANESVIKVFNDGVFTLSDSTIRKSGDSTAVQNSDFRGLNAAVLAETKGKITLSNCTITTSAEGANAVFATGQGSAIALSNVKIRTTGRGSSRGMESTFGGAVTGTNVDISTTGAHCAALATDRGEGTVTLTGGTLTTAGDGSPVIYSTGNITANGIKGTATGSEAAVIEGKNSITLTNSTLVGHRKCGVMLYQSFSGDAGVGTSIFTMTGGSLTAEVGPLFYCTNTRVKINLTGAELTAKSGKLLDASAGRWGRRGRNGADVTLMAQNQKLAGDVSCDGTSTIAATLTESTSLKGAVNSDNTAKSISLVLGKSSTWEVTGTSYVTSLTDADATMSNIIDNGFTIYYDQSAAANAWLGGKEHALAKGGRLVPR